MQYKGVFDPMDGIGFDFEKYDISPFPKFQDLEKLHVCDLSVDKLKPRTTPAKLLKGFHDCVDPLFEDVLIKMEPKNFSLEICKIIKKCDTIPEFTNLSIDEFPNDHEIKWAILPKCKEDNVMVTLGIGLDVKAEVLLSRTLPNTTFYGADPIIQPNLQMYSHFGGKFFPFAVGKDAGINRFKVLPNQNKKTREYTYQDVTTIDVPYFFNNILKLKRIDFLWIDIEGGELTFLHYLNRGNQFDKLGITVCQFNVELHPDFWPNGYQIVFDFIPQILRENRYVFLKPLETTTGVFRLFFINVENQECVRKYIQ
ncbi:unnamed protein product [Caenorhabditis angaria]|nr:unnamed protein product [Caenorhabditis angaria]